MMICEALRSVLSGACVVDHLQDKKNFTFYRFRAAQSFSLLTYDSIGGTGHVHKRPASSSTEEATPV
jgi:hypothetical protein